jgi:hypothetical protein
MNGVNEVYIYCGAHTDQVEDYIGRSRWSTTSRSCPFSILQFVRVADARSAGDVLRDMDKRSLVDGDFILVHGDLVSNILLDDILAARGQPFEHGLSKGFLPMNDDAHFVSPPAIHPSAPRRNSTRGPGRTQASENHALQASNAASAETME